MDKKPKRQRIKNCSGKQKEKREKEKENEIKAQERQRRTKRKIVTKQRWEVKKPLEGREDLRSCELQWGGQL